MNNLNYSFHMWPVHCTYTLYNVNNTNKQHKQNLNILYIQAKPIKCAHKLLLQFLNLYLIVINYGILFLLFKTKLNRPKST